MKTNCIVCNAELENWDEIYPEDKPTVHPMGGTAFRTYGHYGSSVFDPMDASYLEVVVCDPCLRNRMERTYRGVNEQYKAELDEQRAEMDALISEILLKEHKE